MSKKQTKTKKIRVIKIPVVKIKRSSKGKTRRPLSDIFSPVKFF